MHSSLKESQPEPLNQAQSKLERLIHPAHPLCKDDLIWILEYIKKKVAEEEPQLLELSQPRLLQNFRFFADIALMLIHRRSSFDQEADRLKEWIAEASFGLHPEPRGSVNRKN